MNRTLKRVLGLTGSVMLGVAGAVTFASAAQAHHPLVTGTPECLEDGGWTVTWEVYDWDGNHEAIGTVDSVEGDLDDGGAIVPGAVLSDTPLIGTQTLTADDAMAEIEVFAKWDNNATGSTVGTVSAPAEGCEEEPPAEPEPEVEVYGSSDCFGVYAEANNLNSDALAEFTFAPSNGDPISYTPEVDEWFWEYFPLEDAAAGLSVDILVDGELYDTVEWTDNPLCHYATVEVDCAEGLIYTLTVPADGDETTFYFYPDYSEEEIVEVVAPGETKTVTIPPVDNTEFWVYYYVSTQKDEVWGETPWTPCDEESPSPSETPSAAPQLPTTGSSLTIMISSAAALILAAGVIFMVMRRRRAAQDW